MIIIKNSRDSTILPINDVWVNTVRWLIRLGLRRMPWVNYKRPGVTASGLVTLPCGGVILLLLYKRCAHCFLFRF